MQDPDDHVYPGAPLPDLLRRERGEAVSLATLSRGHLNKIASEDHSYIVMWYERRMYEHHWKLALNIQG